MASSPGSEITGLQRGDGSVVAVSLSVGGPLIAGGAARVLAVNSYPPVGTLYRNDLLSVPDFAKILAEYPAKTAALKKNYATLEDLNEIQGFPTVTQTKVPLDEVLALRAAAVWMYAQPGFKTQMLTDGLNPRSRIPSPQSRTTSRR